MLSSPLIVFTDKVTHRQTDRHTHTDRHTDKSDHNTPSHFMWREKKKTRRQRPNESQKAVIIDKTRSIQRTQTPPRP